MPQDMNNPGGQGLSDTSWDKATSTSVQEDAARVRSSAMGTGAGAYDSIKDGAQSLGNQAKEQAAGYVESGKQAVTQSLEDFAQAIRRASDELNRNEQTMASQIVRQAAGGLESLSRSVNGASIDDMIDSVRRFGRRNPAAFIGGAVLVGLALGRFARSSGRHGSDDWREDDWRDEEAWRGERSGGAEWRGGQGRGGQGGQDWRAGDEDALAPRPYSGSSYSAGEGSSFSSANRGFGEMPAPSQGYAGGGMGADPIQSSGPSSERDESVASSSASGGSAQPGSIATGER